MQWKWDNTSYYIQWWVYFLIYISFHSSYTISFTILIQSYGQPAFKKYVILWQGCRTKCNCIISTSISQSAACWTTGTRYLQAIFQRIIQWAICIDCHCMWLSRISWGTTLDMVVEVAHILVITHSGNRWLFIGNEITYTWPNEDILSSWTMHGLWKCW